MSDTVYVEPTADDASQAEQTITDTKADNVAYLGFLGALVVLALVVTMSEVSAFFQKVTEAGEYVSKIPDLALNLGLMGSIVFDARSAVRPGYQHSKWNTALRYFCAAAVLVLNCYLSLFPHNTLDLSDANPGGLIASLSMPLFLYFVAEVIAVKIAQAAETINMAKDTLRNYAAAVERRHREAEERADRLAEADREEARQAERRRRERDEAREDEDRLDARLKLQAEARSIELAAETEAELRRTEAAAEAQAKITAATETARLKAEAEGRVVELNAEAEARERILKAEAEAELKVAEAANLKAQAEARAAETEAFTATSQVQAEALREAELLKANAQAAAILKDSETRNLKAQAALQKLSEAPSVPSSRPSVSAPVGPSVSSVDPSVSGDGASSVPGVGPSVPGERPAYGPSGIMIDSASVSGLQGQELKVALREAAIFDMTVSRVGGPSLKPSELARLYDRSAAWASSIVAEAELRIDTDPSYVERAREAIGRLQIVELETIYNA